MTRRKMTVTAAAAGLGTLAMALLPAGSAARGPEPFSAAFNAAKARGAQNVLELTGSDGVNVLGMSNALNGDHRFESPGGLTSPGSPCVQDSTTEFHCPAGYLDGVIVRSGRGNDGTFAAKAFNLITNQFGGPGKDTGRGGRKFDLLKGQGSNDFLAGRAGADQLVGGGGSNDVCKGGPGNDLIQSCE